jgi:3-hydroxyacyl-[acyl-carrier-protein] dehydratase
MTSEYPRPSALIPHRPPFLLVDRIVAYDSVARELLAERLIPLNEPWTASHFPHRSIVPGVIITEGMAQTCGLLLRLLRSDLLAHDHSVGLAKLSMRYLRPVSPGATIRYSVKLELIADKLAKFNGSASVNCDRISMGSLVLSVGLQK